MALGFVLARRLQHKANKGFTLIEMAIVLSIIGVLSAVALSLLWNTESADAALVRSVQEQLYSGASQAAMLTGLPPNTTANLVTLAAFITSHLDSRASATLDCSAGAGVCTLTLGTKSAAFLVGLSGSVQVTAVTGFSRYTVAGGEIVAS